MALKMDSGILTVISKRIRLGKSMPKGPNESIRSENIHGLTSKLLFVFPKNPDKLHLRTLCPKILKFKKLQASQKCGGIYKIKLVVLIF